MEANANGRVLAVEGLVGIAVGQGWGHGECATAAAAAAAANARGTGHTGAAEDWKDDLLETLPTGWALDACALES